VGHRAKSEEQWGIGRRAMNLILLQRAKSIEQWADSRERRAKSSGTTFRKILRINSKID